ncbi:GNAT family N-acetyltransferase [Microbulbifer hainanensis]|uniref:GNAT family N-acetyltransferase n=1 Tax=Microbulbifer hainanensis TaxID=2735675 RepID=UPI001868AE53|nr:GNAT family N-acetyltransferase [Microbulbifer hainanensis]
MASEQFVVQTMTRDQLDFAVDWAAREGWNPGLHDAACFYATDPGGFFAGLLDGKLVACVSAVRYGRDFGFMGFYIVDPALRHRGYGLETARAGLAYLAGRTIGLDGVVEQQHNYRKSGFEIAWRNVRYRGTTAGEAASDAVVSLAQVPFAAIAGYDRQCFPAEREDFLRAWIGQPDAKALGILHDGVLQGYGVIRACRDGYKIGPLFADSERDGKLLFRALSAAVPAGHNLFLDIPEPNAAARALVRRHDMEMVFETARMYLGEVPALPLEKIYGITTFELG